MGDRDNETKENTNELSKDPISKAENELERRKEEIIRKGLYLNTETKLQEKQLLKRCMKRLRQDVLACESIVQVREIMSIQEKLKKWNVTDCISRFAWDLVGMWEHRFREKVCKELATMGFGETNKNGPNENKKKKKD